MKPHGIVGLEKYDLFLPYLSKLEGVFLYEHLPNPHTHDTTVVKVSVPVIPKQGRMNCFNITPSVFEYVMCKDIYFTKKEVAGSKWVRWVWSLPIDERLLYPELKDLKHV